MLGDAEERAQAYSDYAAEIRSVAAKCKLQAEKAELEKVAENLDSLVPLLSVRDTKKRA